MNFLRTIILATVTFSFFVLIFPQNGNATTLTTSQDTKGGQVITRNEDGTLYLTTQIATPAGSTTTQANRTTSSLSSANFKIPVGFATNFDQFLNAILSAVMLICALLVLFYLITGALQWITSGGDKGKIEQARNKMFAAVVGIIIVASSYAILILVLNFLGFESLDDLFRQSRTINERTGIRLINTSPNPTATNSAQTDLGELSI